MFARRGGIQSIEREVSMGQGTELLYDRILHCVMDAGFHLILTATIILISCSSGYENLRSREVK